LNILVTGGAGYLGSTLIGYLLKLGANVDVVDNFLFSKTSLNHYCFDERLRIFKGDVRDDVVMKPLIRRADLVIPLAAIVGAPACNESEFQSQSINYTSIYNLLRNLSKNQHLIMPTTNSAYGTGDENNFCTEESPLNPISSYAIEKVKVEQLIMERENSISYRLATVFGMSPRMRVDLLVNDFVYRALKDGSTLIFEGHFKRNYIHVRDVARAFVHAIENFGEMRGSIFNVGLSDANISKLELCQRIQKHLPNFTVIEADVGKDIDQRNYIVSNSKLEATGFKTMYSLDDGIAELIKGYIAFNKFEHGNV